MTNNDQSPTTVISGIFLMVLAVFALPALLRFLVPATAAMASGNAGAAAGKVVGATLATGAVLATGGAGKAAWAARPVPTSIPAMPTGARAGGVPGARTTAVLHGVNTVRGKGSAGGSSAVGGQGQ
jgi:hypothetical protein